MKNAESLSPAKVETYLLLVHVTAQTLILARVLGMSPKELVAAIGALARLLG